MCGENRMGFVFCFFVDWWSFKERWQYQDRWWFPTYHYHASTFVQRTFGENQRLCRRRICTSHFIGWWVSGSSSSRLQRDVVYLCWPIVPSYISPHVWGRGGVGGSQPMSTAVIRSPNKLWRSNSIFNLWEVGLCKRPIHLCCVQSTSANYSQRHSDNIYNFLRRLAIV